MKVRVDHITKPLRGELKDAMKRAQRSFNDSKAAITDAVEDSTASINQTVEDLKPSVAETLSAAKESADHLVNTGREMAEDYLNEAKRHVKRNPAKGMAVAVGLGILAGATLVLLAPQLGKSRR
jgi:ElaB/YqjD/DUF883 family membrane-anchored ribosome-binding protein